MKVHLLPVIILTSVLSLFLNSSPSAQVNSGKISDFKSKLDRAVERSGFRTTEIDSVKIITDQQTEVDLLVNFRKIILNENHYYGNIANAPGSSFRIFIDGDSLDGVILDRLKKIAYKIKSDKVGNLEVLTTKPENVICIEYNSTNASTPDVVTAPGSGSVAYTLQSNPSSKSVAYLDFDGQRVQGTLWNKGNLIVAAPGNFSETEVQRIFNLVSEDYAGFNINITTDSNVYNAAARTSRMRCIFTPTNTASPGSGGVAYVGSFTWGDGIPCWVFNSGAKNAGEAASHEIGHTLGLNHDGRTQPKQDYFGGHGNWAPIMGTGYTKSIVQWSRGEYQYANTQEDDINIITTRNGFGYKTDDAGNTIAAAAALKIGADGVVSASANKGVIERRTDVDIYKFDFSGGSVSFTASPATEYPNLDIKLELLDAQGTVLVSANPSGFSASLTYNLTQGTYYLSVDGVGYNSPQSDGYSDYSSIGNYSISGTLPFSGVSNNLPNVAISSPKDGSLFYTPADIIVKADASDADGTIQKVEFFNGSLKIGESTSSPFEFTWSDVVTGNYNITARATDNSSGSFTSTIVRLSVVQPLCSVANAEVIYNNIIGTDSSYRNSGFTKELAFDDDSTTYFDSPYGNGSWVGVDMDGIYTITGVRYYPRALYVNRMTGGKIQGSSTPDFSAGVVDLATITGNPELTWNCLKINNSGSFKYVRYLSPDNSNGNLADIQFYGIKINNQPPTAHITSPINKTYFILPTSVRVDVTGTDPDGTVSKVELYDGSNKIGEKMTAPYQFALELNTVKTWNLVAKVTDNLGDYSISDTVILNAVNPLCSVEGALFTTYSVLGTTGSFNNSTNTREKAFDKDTNTYFMAPSGSNSWVGMDLGKEMPVTGVRFFPRKNYEHRMMNGRFQVANNASFTQGVTTIETITEVNENEWNCITFQTTFNKRYIRYVSPYSGYCNIAELEVYVNESSIAGVNDYENAGKYITYFPNPAKDQVNIFSDHEILKVTLSNLHGVVLANYDAPSIAFSLPEAAGNGMYFVTTYLKSGKVLSSKLFIQK